MDIKITPTKLKGEVRVPSSKSFAHRQIMCAAFAKGEIVIENVSMSQDIAVTIGAMNELGADIKADGTNVTVRGIEKIPTEPVTIDCGESGSTLRFVIPVAAALGVTATFTGRGKLPSRPITPYVTELSKKGISFNGYDGSMPFTISGKLQSGDYRIAGDISSQFVTGLILGLSLIEGRSTVTLTSPLQSKPYVDITLRSLEMFGRSVARTENGFEIIGGNDFVPCKTAVEDDFSQAAFFFVANALGSCISMPTLPLISAQGDSIIRSVVENKKAFELDCSDIPDIVPIMSVLATQLEGTTKLTNVARLRIKESDRIETTLSLVNALGGKARCVGDEIHIEGKTQLKGGRVNSHNDHRIAMSAAIAATVCENEVIIEDAGCVKKSYPHFFDDYNKLGGNANVINLE